MLAKSLVRNRQYVTKMHHMKANLQAVSLKITVRGPSSPGAFRCHESAHSCSAWRVHVGNHGNQGPVQYSDAQTYYCTIDCRLYYCTIDWSHMLPRANRSGFTDGANSACRLSSRQRRWRKPWGAQHGCGTAPFPLDSDLRCPLDLLHAF